MEKGVWRFEIALGLFLYVFLVATLGKGSIFFFSGTPGKRESGDLRLLVFFLFFFWEATLGKGSLEISGCFGIIYFFWVATLGKRNPEI